MVETEGIVRYGKNIETAVSSS